MLRHFPSQIRQIFLAATFLVLPGLTVFMWTHYRANAGASSSPASLNVNGLLVAQSIIDVGSVWSGGQTVWRKYTLDNETGHDIQIDSVASDCGCTVATSLKSTVHQGESAAIPVEFWPPPVANDIGGRFQRTITVSVATFSGKRSLSLFLTGFIEPDGSLKEFPVNVDIGESQGKGIVSTILHFKGLSKLLSQIPDTLTVKPGVNQRVILSGGTTNGEVKIIHKDVNVELADQSDTTRSGSWDSAITFAPDMKSDGLTVHLRGHRPQQVTASSQSVMLTDEPSNSEANIRLQCLGPICVSDLSITSDLPLQCDLIVQQANSAKECQLNIRVSGPITQDVTGAIRISLGGNAEKTQVLSIPIVLLHRANIRK